MSILAVDDNTAHCYALKRILSSAGHAVLEAHCGSSALDMAVSLRPDVILLDIHLPDFTGFEVTRRLREDARTKQIGIVLHTASEPTAEAKTMAESLGADAFLTYPIDTQDLLITIQAVIAKVKLRNATVGS